MLHLIMIKTMFKVILFINTFKMYCAYQITTKNIFYSIILVMHRCIDCNLTTFSKGSSSGETFFKLPPQRSVRLQHGGDNILTIISFKTYLAYLKTAERFFNVLYLNILFYFSRNVKWVPSNFDILLE